MEKVFLWKSRFFGFTVRLMFFNLIGREDFSSSAFSDYDGGEGQQNASYVSIHSNPPLVLNDFFIILSSLFFSSSSFKLFAVVLLFKRKDCKCVYISREQASGSVIYGLKRRIMI